MVGGVLCILSGIIYRLDVCFTHKNDAFGLPKLTPLTFAQAYPVMLQHRVLLVTCQKSFGQPVK